MVNPSTAKPTNQGTMVLFIFQITSTPCFVKKSNWNLINTTMKRRPATSLLILEWLKSMNTTMMMMKILTILNLLKPKSDKDRQMDYQTEI